MELSLENIFVFFIIVNSLATMKGYTLRRIDQGQNPDYNNDNVPAVKADGLDQRRKVALLTRNRRSTEIECYIQMNFPDGRTFYIRPYRHYVLATRQRFVWNCHYISWQNGISYMFTWQDKVLSSSTSGLTMGTKGGSSVNTNTIFTHIYNRFSGHNVLKTYTSPRYVTMANYPLATLTNSGSFASHIKILRA